MSIPVETVRTSDFEMDYFRFGHGRSTAVILPGLSIKSVMDSRETVAKQYASWNDEFTTYLFDRRKDLPTKYTVYDMARDTAAAMRVLGLSDVCLFGASQGGMIALALTISDPDLVGRLALGSTTACAANLPFAGSWETPDGSGQDPEAKSGPSSDSGDGQDPEAKAGPSSDSGDGIGNWIELARCGDARKLYLEFGKKLYPPALFERYKNILEGLSNFVTKDDLSRFITIADGTEGFDVRASLGKITCPVLVLGANDDQVIPPAHSIAIRDGLTSSRRCELYMYDGCGHAAFDTAPDYQERLLRFFTA